jgi:alkylmercury lyase
MEQRAGTTTNTGHWLDDPDDTLPEPLQRTMGAFLGAGRVETLADGAAAIRAATGGGSFDVEDLCHADGSTGHRATVDGETYEFQCFYDAVVLAEVADSPADIRTAAPDGTVVEAHADGDGGLVPTLEGATMSFGVADDAPAGEGTPTLAETYGAICPYVKAFPDRAAYEGWAAGVPAATVGLPLADATTLARHLADP